MTLQRHCRWTVGSFPVLHPVEIVFDLGRILLPTFRQMVPHCSETTTQVLYRLGFENIRGELNDAVCNWNSGLGERLRCLHL